MISKESLVLIAIILVLALTFMYWSQDTSDVIQGAIDGHIEDVLKP